jgi:amino acid transporter
MRAYGSKVTVGEAENPRKNIPIAIRRTFWRILVFYVGGVFVMGLIVPSTNKSLFVATQSKTGAAASPFVVATTLVNLVAIECEELIILQRIVRSESKL